MNSISLPRTINPEVGKPKKAFEFIKAYVIIDPCIITKNQLMKGMTTYNLVDFLDDGLINSVTVKFLNANQTGNTLKISLLNMKTKQVIQRTKHIDNDICHWVITDLFTNPEDIINDYCENN